MTDLEREALTALRQIEAHLHRIRSNDSGSERWESTKRDTDPALDLIAKYQGAIHASNRRTPNDGRRGISANS